MPINTAQTSVLLLTLFLRINRKWGEGGENGRGWQREAPRESS